MSSHHLVWVVLMASTGADVWVRGQHHRSHSGTLGAGALRSNPKAKEWASRLGQQYSASLQVTVKPSSGTLSSITDGSREGSYPVEMYAQYPPACRVKGARAVTPGQPDASDCSGCVTQGRADRAHTLQDRAIARWRALSQAGHQLAELVPAAHQAFGPALGGLPPLPQRCHLCRVCGVGRGMDGRLWCGAARWATQTLNGTLLKAEYEGRAGCGAAARLARHIHMAQ